MQQLHDEDVEALTELLLEDLPRSILNIVADNPRISEGAIVSRLLRMLPSDVDQEKLQRHCRRTLWWFIDSGCVASAGSHRYVIVPTYAVLRRGTDRAQIHVFGDGRRDSLLRQALLETDINMIVQSVIEYGRHVGLTREIKVDVRESRRAEEILKTYNVPLVHPEELQLRLKDLDHIRSPARSSFSSSPPSFGIWEQYGPNHIEQSRWMPAESATHVENLVLLRWRRDDEWYGRQNARYFLDINEPLLSELDEDLASYWMLHFDQLAGEARRFWATENRVWVPRMLPSAYRHWLWLLADESTRHDHLLEYKFTGATNDVGSQIANKLGLRMIRSAPTF